MIKELADLYQELEKGKADMLDRIETLSVDQRAHNHAPGEWSPLQVLAHVVGLEEWMAGIKSAALPPNAKVQLRGRLFVKYAGEMMRSGRRIPSIPMAVPPEKPEYADVAQRWHEARRVLKQKLDGVTPDALVRPIAVHPMAGPLNPEQVLDLLDAHLYYHNLHFPKFSGQPIGAQS